MRVVAVLAAGILTSAGCARPAPPSPDLGPIRDLLVRLQQMSQEGRHGPHHRADNSLQRDLWSKLKDLPSSPTTDPLLLEAAECVYTRYDENYFQGLLWHWPYLSSRRAIELCDRLLPSSDPETRERALWIKAFALRCPPNEAWGEAEGDLETYAEQVRWRPDFEASRNVLRQIAREFPDTPRGKAAAKLVEKPDLSLVLPKGPRERDPRNPDN
jgi:hypothetical protein